MEGLDTTEDREPVWTHNSDYWSFFILTKFLSRNPTSAKHLFNKISKTYMSRTCKRGGGSMGGGPSVMMRMGKIDDGSMGSGQEWRKKMGKRSVGSIESMKNLMMRIENISNISRSGKKDGQNHFMIRMGERGRHNRIMKRKNN